MKKNTFTLILFLTVALATAQTKTKTYATSAEMINKINDIVKPLKDQAEKLMKEDATGTFKSYQNDVLAINKIKEVAVKEKAVQQLRAMYFDYFKNIWSQLKADEKFYQERIRSVFPIDMKERISFQEFLNFSINYSSSKPTAPPEPPSSPKNICIDVCPIAVGEVTSPGGFIAGGTGSFGNCFLRASGWAAVAGNNVVNANLKNNITIPGTFPVDSRKLRVKKSFDLKQEATAICLFGCSISETLVRTYQGYEYLEAIAPFIFMASKTVGKSYSEEYVIEKTEVSNSIIKASASNTAVLITGNWSFSECNNIKWSICEEE